MIKRPAQRLRIFLPVIPAAWALLVGAAICRPQPAAMLESALSGLRSINTLNCTVVRMQMCAGVTKNSRCIFSFDRKEGKWAYEYASPYEYTFTADDSAVVGVNRRTRQGYRVKASADPSRYKDLSASVHLLEPLLQFIGLDTLVVSLKASINDFLYFERIVAAGKELIKVDRPKNAVVLVEAIDSLGDVKRQTAFEYDTSAGKRAVFPKKIIIRQNPAGIMSVDTLLISKLEINKKLKKSAFAAPEFR